MMMVHSRLGFTQRDLDPLSRGDAALHERVGRIEEGDRWHETCIEVTGPVELMLGTRTYLCGRDCPQASDQAKCDESSLRSGPS